VPTTYDWWLVKFHHAARFSRGIDNHRFCRIETLIELGLASPRVSVKTPPATSGVLKKISAPSG
jgi:hypothetical protein